jgi:hypothetical protein
MIPSEMRLTFSSVSAAFLYYGVSDKVLRQVYGSSTAVEKSLPVRGEVDKLHVFAEGGQVLERVLHLLELQTNAVGLVDDLEDGIPSRRLVQQVVDVGHLDGRDWQDGCCSIAVTTAAAAAADRVRVSLLKTAGS